MAPQQGTGGMGQQNHPRQLGSSALGQLSDARLTLAQCDGRRKQLLKIQPLEADSYWEASEKEELTCTIQSKISQLLSPKISF